MWGLKSKVKMEVELVAMKVEKVTRKDNKAAGRASNHWMKM